MEDKKDKIVSQLNNFMESDSDFWTEEFGCEKEDIVPDYGFGYTNEGNHIYYLAKDDAIEVPVDLEVLESSLQKCTTSDDYRNLIFWIYEQSE